MTLSFSILNPLSSSEAQEYKAIPFFMTADATAGLGQKQTALAFWPATIDRKPPVVAVRLLHCDNF